MNRCVYCQGRVIPLFRWCLQCHRRQPALQAEPNETSERVLTNVEQEEAQLGEVSQPLPANSPQRRLSRRTALKVAGAAGVVLGVGAAGRLASLLAQNHPLVTYRGHDAGIWALAWPSDSHWMASTSGDEAQVWEALSGRLMHRFPDDLST